MKHILGVCTNTYHGFTLEQALDGIAAAGFKYVELTGVRNWTEHVSSEMTDHEIDDLKKKLDRLGLKAFAMSGHCNLLDDKRLDDFVQNINFAGKMGCSYIVSSAGEAHFGDESEPMDEVLIANIKKILPICKKREVQLVLEVHGEYGTGEQLKVIVDAVDSPWVKINYDTANVVFYGKQYPHTEIQTCADEVGYVHLKDKLGEMGEWNFPAPGKGSLKLMDTIKYLHSRSYDGPFSVEVEFTEDFTMNPKKDGDIEVVNRAVKDAYDFFAENGLTE